MLPILRVFPVGGVLLAIIVLALALSPPGRTSLPPDTIAARGALIARAEHPEWRQFLILAAIRRADEILRLRDLPDSPPEAKPAPELAALPGKPRDDDAPDSTGSIADDPAAALPVDIGETSSTELPISAAPEQPPVIDLQSLTPPPASDDDKPPPTSEIAKPPAATEIEKPLVARDAKKPGRASALKKPARASRSRHVRHLRPVKPPAKPGQTQSFNAFAPHNNNTNPPLQPPYSEIR
jgi:hypothetical protein